MQEQVLAAAVAPAMARAAPRRDAAEAMVALGMGAEAQSLIQLAVTDDPRAATPDLAGLGAIAALIAGRAAESAPLDDPALTGTDEIALWRAVRAARLHEGAPEAAAVFANTLAARFVLPGRAPRPDPAAGGRNHGARRRRTGRAEARREPPR